MWRWGEGDARMRAGTRESESEGEPNTAGAVTREKKIVLHKSRRRGMHRLRGAQATNLTKHAWA